MATRTLSQRTRSLKENLDKCRHNSLETVAIQIETMESEKSSLVSSLALLRTDLNSLTQTMKGQAMELSTLTQTMKSQAMELSSQAMELSTLTQTVKSQAMELSSQAMEIQPLKAENNRLRKKDFIVQLQELCYEVQRFVCSGTECTSLGEYSVKFWANAKTLLEESRQRYLSLLKSYQQAVSKGNLKDASNNLNGLVSFDVRKGGDHVHSVVDIDKDFLLECIRDFDKITIRGHEYPINDKPSWTAFVTLAFDNIASLTSATSTPVFAYDALEPDAL